MKYYFGDNREYGADDIKDAFGTIAAESGISIGIEDGVEYSASELNDIIGSAVTSGVVPESNSSLKLIYEDGGYCVCPGRAVFSDGGIAVLEEKQNQKIQKGQYLYLAYSTALDDVYFLTSDTPQSEDGEKLLIAIAYVERDGTIKNMRTYAKGKIPALPNAKWNNLREVEFTVDVSNVRKNGGYVEAVHEFEGEMNFMLADRYTGIAASMHIGDKVRYCTAYKVTSRLHGFSKEFIGVGATSYEIVEGTLIDHGDGYIKMRYRIPSQYEHNTLKYTALIGVEL